MASPWGGEAAKRRPWRMKWAAEVKKQEAMPTLQGRQCDHVSEGVVTIGGDEVGIAFYIAQKFPQIIWNGQPHRAAPTLFNWIHRCFDGRFVNRPYDVAVGFVQIFRDDAEVVPYDNHI